MGNTVFIDKPATPSARSPMVYRWCALVLITGLSWLSLQVLAQGQEDFSNIPTNSAGSYLNRTWTGSDGVTWTGVQMRTDQTLNGPAACIRGTGGGKVVSPVYAGGMGTLSFSYVRAFTGTGNRTLQVWVNGVQVGGNIIVDPNSNVVQTYSAAINISGNVQLELRAIGNQITIDDIQWTSSNQPTARFDLPASSALEDAGSVAVDLTINPPPSAAGTITIAIAASSTATYGATNDYTTTPAAAGGTTITVNVPANATSASFNVNIIDDLITEPDETIIFNIVGVSGGILSIGPAHQHVFTIIDNDNTPTISFNTPQITVLEDAGTVTFTLGIMPTAHPPGSVTISLAPGPGAGADYGTDYTTTPNGTSDTLIIPIGPNAPTVSFTATIIDDLLPEPTETVTFTISGVSSGFAIGGQDEARLVIGDNDSPPSVLAPGDLLVVGVNASAGACGVSSDVDYVSFFSFKEIAYGTQLIITDNGYERCQPGLWGNSEGTVVLTRTGPGIPAGQVITLEIRGSFTGGAFPNIVGWAPDAGWSCTALNLPPGGGTPTVALNNGGDQLFFMQGGTWTSGTHNGHNASYDGTILFGFSTNPTHPWEASCTVQATQRSNLPPGVECFSMSPLSASDWSKYKGPITPATQRDWIIRMENAANWEVLASCADYNSTGYDWSTAPILPIIPGNMSHGLWRGAVNTDWFECKNWDDARIPDPATDVVLDNRAIRNCIVGLATGLNPAGTATCATFNQTFTGSDPIRAFQIHANSTLTVGGLFKVTNTSASNLVDLVLPDATLNAGDVIINGNATTNTTLTFQANSTLHTGSMLVDANAPGQMNAFVNANAENVELHVADDLTLDHGARLHLNPGAGKTAYLYLGGDFINQEDESHFVDQNSTVVLNGSGDQHIINNDPVAPTEFFNVLRLDKPSGDVYLDAPITIRTELDLTAGRLFSSPTRMATLQTNSTTVVNTSNASFVHGPITRVGNSDFTFPIGKGHSYRPASLEAITGGLLVAFTAEYFNSSAIDDIGWDHEWPPINHVSDCEYWRIDRSNGAPNARVTLSWSDPESCGVNDLPMLRVAYWDETQSPMQWMDRGGYNTTGNNFAGTVSTTNVESLFAQTANYWTLASHTTQNPLPIELVEFDAVPYRGEVELSWITASENNNDYFTVERSADSDLFQPILTVNGAGNSQNFRYYSGLDTRPIPGWSYYRLRQTDFDGTTELSAVVPVHIGAGGHSLTILYDGQGPVLQHDLHVGSMLEVRDPSGRLVYRTTLNNEGPYRIPTAGLAHGAYLLRAIDGQRVEILRFAY